MVNHLNQHEVFLVGFDKAFSNSLTKCIAELRPKAVLCCFRNEGDAIRILQARAYPEQPSLLLIAESSIDNFLWKVKAHRLTRQIPVLVLAQPLSKESLERGYKLGANSIIQMPLSVQSLRSTLKITLSYWLDFCRLPKGISPLMTGS